jgi:hypothetical protein
MKYNINNTTLEVLIACLIIVFISQLVIILIGLRKNHLLKIDHALEANRTAYRNKIQNHVCIKYGRKAK